MPDLTPLEAAEHLQRFIDYAGDVLNGELKVNLCKVVDTTISMLRQISTGELKLVVHAHWLNETIRPEYPEFYTGICSNCGTLQNSEGQYCRECGALMDENEKSE